MSRSFSHGRHWSSPFGKGIPRSGMQRRATCDTPELAKAFGRTEPRGALVTDVIAGSPVAHGGLRNGDIIVTFDGVPVADARELPALVAQRPVGTQTTITVLREGKEITATVTLGKLADVQTGITSGEEDEKRWGVTVANFTPEVARRFQLETNRPGVVVVDIAPASPASEAGLRVGDVIGEVNRNPLSSVAAFVEVAAKAGESGTLLLLGGSASFFVLRRNL